MSADSPAPMPQNEAVCQHGKKRCCCELKKELEAAQTDALASAAKYDEAAQRVTAAADRATKSLSRPDSRKFRVRKI